MMIRIGPKMANNSVSHFNKVVVTVDLDNYLSSTIELAAALALANQTGLHGLFVEDQDLLHMAGFSFTREVSLVSAQSRVLDHQQLLCSFNARSRHFRQSLAHHAEQSSLPWSYSTVRGQKIKMALEKSIDAEYLIIGQSKETRTQAAISLSSPIRILLMNNHHQRLQQALDVVVETLAGQSIELLTMSSNDSDNQNIELLEDKIKTFSDTRITPVDKDSLPAVLAMQNQPVSYVIASRHDAEIIQPIMQQANCPVIVVS